MQRNTHRGVFILAIIAGLTLITSSTLHAVTRTPVSTNRVGDLLQSCLLQGGGDHRNDHQLPVLCCATNDEGTRWCVACFSGTAENPSDCSITTPREVLRNRLQTTPPSGGVVAPPPSSTRPPRRSGQNNVPLNQSPNVNGQTEGSR